MSKYLNLKEGLAPLFLVWAMLFVSTTAILRADWIDGLGVIVNIATIGIVTGLLLAKSRFSSNTAHLFATVYGAFIVVYLIGASNLDLLGDLSWRGRVLDMLNRQGLWIQKVIDGSTNRDGLIFIMHTSVIFWMLGYSASWYTFRTRQVWRVVLPTGLVLLSVVYYYYGPELLEIHLGIFAILALIYISQMHLINQEGFWRIGNIRYDKGITRFNFLWSSFFAGILTLGLAWSMPTPPASAAVVGAVNNVNSPWRSFQDNWTRLFSSLRVYGAGSTNPYSNSLNLGGPRNIGDTLIMDIYVDEKLPSVYWQAVTYDTYTDGSWSNSESSQVEYFPDDGYLNVPLTQARKVVTQTVVNYIPNAGTIYGASQIIAVDKPLFLGQYTNEEGKQIVTSTRSRIPLQQTDSYQVQSQISFANAENLRQSSTNYPAWVVEKYLQVPETLSTETITLSQEFGVNFDNPFDMSIAIRDYLRSNIEYNDQINAPPHDVDPIHYVLFELKQGYCNYYASAMVMLLRLNGVPARIAAGYAQGDYLEDDGFYRVRAPNAHTWVEVYFSDYGWIPFEPTASIPVFDRPTSEEGNGDNFSSETASNTPDRGPQDNEQITDEPPTAGNIDLTGDDTAPLALPDNNQNFTSILQVGVGILIVVISIGLVFIANYLNVQTEADIVKSYGKLGQWANRLGLTTTPMQTPYERATNMSLLIPEARTPIRNLTHQFVLRAFSNKNDQDFDPREEWKILRPILWRQRFSFWLQRLKKPNHKIK